MINNDLLWPRYIWQWWIAIHFGYGTFGNDQWHFTLAKIHLALINDNSLRPRYIWQWSMKIYFRHGTFGNDQLQFIWARYIWQWSMAIHLGCDTFGNDQWQFTLVATHLAMMRWQFTSATIHLAMINTLRPRQNGRQFRRRHIQTHFLEWKC